MLHKETVETSTLELLKRLQSEPLLASFNLVGGTSLALRLGHRKSIDLDLRDNDARQIRLGSHCKTPKRHDHPSRKAL